jgi:putative oxidoreductase
MTLQRLFSSFAEGWPGLGLLLQRVLTSTVLLYFGGARLLEAAGFGPTLPHVLAALAGVLLLFGLWTPLAGTTVAILEAWIFLARLGNPLIAIILVSLGATVAMIGPGVWSVDAQLYGRKRIEPSRQED